MGFGAGTVLLGILLVSGFLLGWISWRGNRFVVESGRFHAAAFAAFALACAGMMSGVQSVQTYSPEEGDHPYKVIPGMAMMGMILTGLAWAPYVALVVAHYATDAIPRSLMGDHNLVVEPTFDQGDAAMKGRDFARALALYEKERIRTGGHADAFLRMADAQRALGRAADAIASERAAARAAKDPDRRGPILLLLAEHQTASRDVAATRATLEGILADPRLAPYHDPARKRLGALAG